MEGLWRTVSQPWRWLVTLPAGVIPIGARTGGETPQETIQTIGEGSVPASITLNYKDVIIEIVNGNKINFLPVTTAEVLAPEFEIDESVGGELDPELVPLLNELNAQGLQTMASNYGPRSSYPRSWVSFTTVLTPKEFSLATTVLQKYGFKLLDIPTRLFDEASGQWIKEPPHTTEMQGKIRTQLEFDLPTPSAIKGLEVVEPESATEGMPDEVTPESLLEPELEAPLEPVTEDIDTEDIDTEDIDVKPEVKSDLESAPTAVSGIELEEDEEDTEDEEEEEEEEDEEEDSYDPLDDDLSDLFETDEEEDLSDLFETGDVTAAKDDYADLSDITELTKEDREEIFGTKGLFTNPARKATKKRQHNRRSSTDLRELGGTTEGGY